MLWAGDDSGAKMLGMRFDVSAHKAGAADAISRAVAARMIGRIARGPCHRIVSLICFPVNPASWMLHYPKGVRDAARSKSGLETPMSPDDAGAGMHALVVSFQVCRTERSSVRKTILAANRGLIAQPQNAPENCSVPCGRPARAPAMLPVGTACKPNALRFRPPLPVWRLRRSQRNCSVVERPGLDALGPDRAEGSPGCLSPVISRTSGSVPLEPSPVGKRITRSKRCATNLARCRRYSGYSGRPAPDRRLSTPASPGCTGRASPCSGAIRR